MVSCLPRRTAVQEEIWFWYRTATIHAGCSSRFAASRVWPPPIVIQFEDTGPTGLPPVEVSGPTGPPPPVPRTGHRNVGSVQERAKFGCLKATGEREMSRCPDRSQVRLARSCSGEPFGKGLKVKLMFSLFKRFRGLKTILPLPSACSADGI